MLARIRNVLMRFEQLIHQVIPDVEVAGDVKHEYTFSVDSRTIQKTDIFIAINGETHDGHTFVVDALQRGAAGAMVSHEKKQSIICALKDKDYKNKVIICVPDPKQALIDLARVWRLSFSIPIIGVTGSAGKTSTKEMIGMLLQKANKQYIASHGNQNTMIGAALNLLRLRHYHEVAVFEMGINKRGEMASLARLVRPTIAAITMVGHCHMEGLGSLQDIALEKRDIFKYFTEDNIGIVNGDQPLLANVSYSHPVIKCGTKTTNQIQARKIKVVNGQIQCTLKIYKYKHDVVLSKPHYGVLTNALITAAVGHILNIEIPVIIKAIEQPIIIKGRFERRSLKSNKGYIISDCYNANPESMKASLVAFEHIQTSATKIAVLGDMLELGVNSSFWHRQIGRFFKKVPSLKKVILVGKMVEWIQETLPLDVETHRVETWQDLNKKMESWLDPKESVILIKGSNGVGLENVVKNYAQ